MAGLNDGMSVSAAMIAGLRASEGTRNGGGDYTDPAHNCTRGVGILVHAGDCTAAELAAAPDAAGNQTALMACIHLAERQVRGRVGKRALSQAQFDALVSVTFNLGGAGAAQVLVAANHDDDRRVVQALRQRVAAAERDRAGNRTGRMIRLPGLVTRREREAQPFLQAPRVR